MRWSKFTLLIAWSSLVIILNGESLVSVSFIFGKPDSNMFDSPTVFALPKKKSNFCHSIRQSFTEPGMSTHCEDVLNSEIKLVSAGDHDADEVIMCMNDATFILDYSRAARFVMSIQIADKLLRVQVNILCNIEWDKTNVDAAFEFVKIRIGSGNFLSIDAYRASLLENAIATSNKDGESVLEHYVNKTELMLSNELWKLPDDDKTLKFIELVTTNAALSASTDINDEMLYELVDIVIAIENDTDFLYIWKKYLSCCHVILIQYGPPSRLNIPNWLDYELYTTDDIVEALGTKANIFSMNSKSIQSFGVLVSKRKYVVLLDKQTLPASYGGKTVHVVAEHVKNLQQSSLPKMFMSGNNPLYGGSGSGFPRGYPQRLRKGVPTAISHGGISNTIDRETLFQTPEIANMEYAYSTPTVPNGTLLLMSDYNLAIDREIIGAAFLFGYTNESYPYHSYGDIFCGFAAKLISDHLGYGVKSGHPNIFLKKSMRNKEDVVHTVYDMMWHEEISAFFLSAKLDPLVTNAVDAYADLAMQIRRNLGSLHPYFIELSDAMLVWLELWQSRNNPGSTTQYLPSASSMGPKYEDSTCAVITLVQNEYMFLPIWLRYYMQHVHDEDIYVLDYNTTDGSTSVNIPSNVNVITISLHDVQFLTTAAELDYKLKQVSFYEKKLLASGYRCVLYSSVDEYIVPDPVLYPAGLISYLEQFVLDASVTVVNIPKYEIIPKNLTDEYTAADHDLKWNESLLSQRYFWFRNAHHNKIHLTKSTTVAVSAVFDESIRMLSFTGADYRYCFAKAYYDHFFDSHEQVGVYTMEDFLHPGRICRSAVYDHIKMYALDRLPISIPSITFQMKLADRFENLVISMEKITTEWSAVVI